jgi:hypothetical protein
MISEQYSNRIKKLSGIIVESKQDIIKNKIGLPDSIAAYLEKEYGKYSIWIANNFKQEIVKELEKNPKYISTSGKIGFSASSGKFDLEVNSDNINQFLNEPSIIKWIEILFKKIKEDKIDYIMDWVLGRGSGAVIEDDKLNFKELTFDKAMVRSQLWHDKLAELKGGQIKDEQGEVIMSFPDGYYWIKLDTSYCSAESEAMGHCGRGEGILFSLRKDKYPVITSDVLKNGTVKQLRGRANTKPKERYHKYIVDFLLSDYVKKIDYNYFKRDENFWLSDLKDDFLIKKIILEKTELLEGQNFDDLSKENVQLIIDTSPYVIPVNAVFDALNINIRNFSELKEYLMLEESLTSIMEIAYQRIRGNLSPISSLFEMFKSSGSLFYNILLESILESPETQIKLFTQKDSKRIINDFISNFESKGKDILENIFIKQNNIIQHYKSENSLIDYIDTIMTSSFGNKGLHTSYNLLKNQKFKSLILKEIDEDKYKDLIDILEFSLDNN